MKQVKTIRAADLFCGAGGTSTGLVEACRELGYRVELTAINHWDVAVATHSENHPEARHLCASLDSINPRDLYAEGELDVLWGSPECTHHSVARGGKPINDQSRATAWCIVRWAEALRPAVILVENVKEFLSWGPIGHNGRPLKSRKGEVYRAWKSCLESLGYQVSEKVLCAADYGDPTTRERLFVQAVRGRRKIVWPNPTHAQEVAHDLFGQLAKWVPARDIIDWDLQGQSIFKRKRPLADKTLNRIWIGLQKFGLKPFIAGMEHGGSLRDAELPLPTITCARGGEMAITEPFLVHLRGNCDAKSIDKPSPTLTSGGGHLGLCEPFLVDCCHGNGQDQNGDKRRVKPVDQPVGALHCANRFGICEPYLVQCNHEGGDRARTTDAPLPTVAGNRGEWAVCEPMLLGQQSGAVGRPVSEPAPTVATSGAIGLVEPYLVKFYRTGTARSINEPLDTVTTNDRFGLAMPTIEIKGEKYLLDIRFRMLKPHELAAAQGFPKGYKFTGNTTQVVKQIGNAVPKNLAKAIVKAALSQ